MVLPNHLPYGECKIARHLEKSVLLRRRLFQPVPIITDFYNNHPNYECVRYRDSEQFCFAAKLQRGPRISPPTNVKWPMYSRSTLNCRRTSPQVQWTHNSNIVVSQCQVVAAFVSVYQVDQTDFSCNLIVKNVTIMDSGSYTCQDQLVADTPSTVGVTVLITAQ